MKFIVKQNLVEKLLLSNFDYYIELVAEAYDKLEIYDEKVVKYWNILNESNKMWFKKIQKELKVDFVEGQPYETQQEMKKDVLSTKVLKISKDFAEDFNRRKFDI